MKEKSDQISCPTCKKIISKRGLFGHLRMAHGKTPEEAHELMGNPDESSHEEHEEIDETIDEEKERIKKVFELIDELKKNEKRKEDIENEETVYTLTAEEAEDLKSGLDDLEEDILGELEDLGINFESEEEEEGEEGPDKKKKS